MDLNFPQGVNKIGHASFSGNRFKSLHFNNDLEEKGFNKIERDLIFRRVFSINYSPEAPVWLAKSNYVCIESAQDDHGYVQGCASHPDQAV